MGRVIARPYVGSPETGFTRTANRHDFSLEPPRDTLLDVLKDAGLAMWEYEVRGEPDEKILSLYKKGAYPKG